jgi:hypothetical protein
MAILLPEGKGNSGELKGAKETNGSEGLKAFSLTETGGKTK